MTKHFFLFPGFGLLILCAITFIIMFLPKSRQLSAIGKEGIYIEDQDDRFSIHSDRYSPSFYHFKPHKTVLGAPAGSLYKETRPESPFFRPTGNSYAGKIRYTYFPSEQAPQSQPQLTPTPDHS